MSVEAADEVPSRLPRNGVVLVGSRERPKWVVFDCPCRTGHRIMVSLDSSHSPHWRIVGDNKLTIWPSFYYRTTVQRCHYVIKHGQVVWVCDKEHRP